ncbi:hypothetical protein [Schumannella soli]|uniref:LytR family transcriptional regulator n=1 Tax=Schumannella soli TaxID=2590779 RepID=A0A506XZ52_9MICO|nr:hypothetical protein [Schumannella soli]TPW78051.1 hypothetical protein FJ657_05340 [Schumannella soli]
MVRLLRPMLVGAIAVALLAGCSHRPESAGYVEDARDALDLPAIGKIQADATFGDASSGVFYRAVINGDHAYEDLSNRLKDEGFDGPEGADESESTWYAPKRLHRVIVIVQDVTGGESLPLEQGRKEIATGAGAFVTISG